MKKIMLALFAFSLLALGANAQDTPKADFSAGYAFAHGTISSGGISTPGYNFNGFNTSGGYNVTSWLGAVGDFGFYHDSPSGSSTNIETYTFGPRIFVRRYNKIVPFGEALFGGSHFSVSGAGSTNPFAMLLGGGAEIPVSGSGRVAIRPDVDYMRLHKTVQGVG